jgi:hypothetical protein
MKIPPNLAAFGTPLSKATYTQSSSAESKSNILNTIMQITLFVGLFYVIYRVNQSNSDQSDKTLPSSDSNSNV